MDLARLLRYELTMRRRPVGEPDHVALPCWTFTIRLDDPALTEAGDDTTPRQLLAAVDILQYDFDLADRAGEDLHDAADSHSANAVDYLAGVFDDDGELTPALEQFAGDGCPASMMALDRVHVAPAWRGRGLATLALCEASLALYRTTDLLVSCPANDGPDGDSGDTMLQARLQRLLETAGYQQIGTVASKLPLLAADPTRQHTIERWADLAAQVTGALDVVDAPA